MQGPVSKSKYLSFQRVAFGEIRSLFFICPKTSFMDHHYWLCTSDMSWYFYLSRYLFAIHHLIHRFSPSFRPHLLIPSHPISSQSVPIPATQDQLNALWYVIHLQFGWPRITCPWQVGRHQLSVEWVRDPPLWGLLAPRNGGISVIFNQHIWWYPDIPDINVKPCSHILIAHQPKTCGLSQQIRLPQPRL